MLSKGGVIGWVDHILLRSSTGGVEEGGGFGVGGFGCFYYEGDQDNVASMLVR